MQSALLEAMQEKQITIGDQTFKLDEPFLVNWHAGSEVNRKGPIPCPRPRWTVSVLKLKIVSSVARGRLADPGFDGADDRHHP